jgi:hypothetical protein
MDQIRVILIAFIAIGILFLAWAAYRGSPIERAHFAVTEMWPTTSPPWPIVGRPLDMNFRYKNVGSGTAFDTVIESLTVLQTNDSISSQ